MTIKSRIIPLEQISKNYDIDRRKWEPILEETKQHISSVKSNMLKHPKSVSFGIADHKEVADNKINPLGVPH